MHPGRFGMMVVCSVFVLGGTASWRAMADDDDNRPRSSHRERDDDEHMSRRQQGHGEREGGERDDGDGDGRRASRVSDPIHAETCGLCHILYPPELLPAAAWERIVGRFPKHFGKDDIDLDAEKKQHIAAYLMSQASSARSELARKARRGLGSTVPERITTLPYIRSKHREISAKVFERKAIGSRSNCGACHRRAAQGDFDDDHVRIPR